MSDWTLGELVERVEYLFRTMSEVQSRLRELEEAGPEKVVVRSELWEEVSKRAERYSYIVRNKLIPLYTPLNPCKEKADERYWKTMNTLIDELIEAEHE